jgi:hypothetical protein
VTIGSLHDEPALREQDHYEVTLRCTSCGDVDLREVWEGEASPCTAMVEPGVECLSTEVERV